MGDDPLQDLGIDVGVGRPTGDIRFEAVSFSYGHDHAVLHEVSFRAEPGEYAEAVLLPGDPLRAQYIAETFLGPVARWVLRRAAVVATTGVARIAVLAQAASRRLESYGESGTWAGRISNRSPSSVTLPLTALETTMVGDA